MAKRMTPTMIRDGEVRWFDRRREKRFFRKNGMSDPLYIAHTEGEAFAYYGEKLPPRLCRNPYPPGRRHDTWQRAYDTADPLGEFHGRNE